MDTNLKSVYRLSKLVIRPMMSDRAHHQHHLSGRLHGQRGAE